MKPRSYHYKKNNRHASNREIHVGKLIDKQRRIIKSGHLCSDLAAEKQTLTDLLREQQLLRRN